MTTVLPSIISNKPDNIEMRLDSSIWYLVSGYIPRWFFLDVCLDSTTHLTIARSGCRTQKTIDFPQLSKENRHHTYFHLHCRLICVLHPKTGATPPLTLSNPWSPLGRARYTSLGLDSGRPVSSKTKGGGDGLSNIQWSSTLRSILRWPPTYMDCEAL